MCNSLGHECLTATRRSVEEYSLGWLHTEFMELVGVLNGVEDHLLEILLNIFETTNIIPGHVGDFNDCFSQ